MATPPKWTFVLTDLAGTVLGELIGADQISLVLPLNRLPTLSLTLPLWHPLAPSLLNTDTMVKAYRRDPNGSTNRLVFVGPVLSVSESGDSINQSIAVSCVGPFWRLTKRLIGTTKTGIVYNSGYTADVPPQPIARSLGQIAHDVLITANGRGYTGIEALGAPTGTPGTLVNGGSMAQGSVGPWWLKPASEAIAELAAGLNSFDYQVVPVEPANVGKAFPQIGYLRVEDIIGVQKPNAIFEYGTPRSNIVGYERPVTRDQYLTRAIVPVSGWETRTDKDLITVEDAARITAVGLFEEAVNDAGVEDDTLRTNIGNEHLKYRKTPKVIVTFTVAENASPVALLDYNVGDFVRGRAIVRGNLRFDAMFRIWGITFGVSENGNESLDLQLVQE